MIDVVLVRLLKQTPKLNDLLSCLFSLDRERLVHQLPFLRMLGNGIVTNIPGKEAITIYWQNSMIKPKASKDNT